MSKRCTLTWLAEAGTTMAGEFGKSGTVTCPTEKFGRKLFKEMARSFEYDPGTIHVVLKHGQDILMELKHTPERRPE